MKRLSTIAIAALLLVPAIPASGAAVAPEARAWAIRIDLPGQPRALVLADVAATATDDPHASAAAFELAGHATPARVTATPADPETVEALNDYTDQTGSLTMQHGFAEAEATRSSTSARAGLDQMTGSGFALADELFTFEQQEQMLGQWQAANDALFGPLNQVGDALAPVLGAAGLTLPALEPITPVGLVDALKASTVASSAEAASSLAFSSARARTTIRELSLFGGFLVVEAVSAEAVSESVGGVDTRSASATVGRVALAGLDLIADDGGVRLAGNDVLKLDALEPILEQLSTALTSAGIGVRIADADDPSAEARDAAAVELSFDTPEGVALLSIGYAAAAAPTTTTLPAKPVLIDPPPAAGGVDTGVPVGLVDVAPPAQPPSSVGGTRTVLTQPLDRRLPEAVARALRTTFLILMVGGLVGAATLPLISSRARRRPSPITIEEVVP